MMHALRRRRIFTLPRPGRTDAGAPGFTMIEVLVAVGVIGAVLLGVAGVFIVSYTNVDHDGRVSRATTYGHQKMEELRNFPFGVLATMVGTHSDPPPERDFTRTWTVTVSADTPPARIATVVVDVSFPSQTGRPAIVQIQSRIAE